jgi:hypothetical protein
MSNQRDTFAKRRREQERKEKARAKQARLAARRAEARPTKGPVIAWDEAVQVDVAGDVAPAAAAPPADPTDDVPGGGS